MVKGPYGGTGRAIRVRLNPFLSRYLGAMNGCQAARGLVLIGGGGHALVVAEAAEFAGFRVVGFLDDYEGAALGRVWETGPETQMKGQTAAGGGNERPMPRLGKLREFEPALDACRKGGAWALGIGGIAIRRELLDGVLALGLMGVQSEAAESWTPPLVHPAAWVSPTARLGRGVYVGPGAVIHSRAVVEDWAIVNSGAIVEHECEIGENAHIAPGAVLGGATRVGRDTLVGIGTRTLPGMKIGAACIVGAGSVVVREVPNGAKVRGVPARTADKGR